MVVALMGGNRAGGLGFEWRVMGVMIPEARFLRFPAVRTALNASTADLYSDLLYYLV